MIVSFIKKIFKNSIDDVVHSQFIRFGKGNFGNRAVLKISRNGKVKINGNCECINDVVLFAFSLLKKIRATGIIFLREKQKQEVELLLNMKAVKKRGSWMIEVDKEFTMEEMEKIRENCLFILTDMNTTGLILKTKKNPPKTAKGVDKVDDKFFSMNLDIKYWPQIKEEFLFDTTDGKKFEISHTYLITEIIPPKDEKDFEKIRILAKRKGKIIRKVIVDGKEIKNEKDIIV
jgi:hypothetical protein